MTNLRDNDISTKGRQYHSNILSRGNKWCLIRSIIPTRTVTSFSSFRPSSVIIYNLLEHVRIHCDSGIWIWFNLLNQMECRIMWNKSYLRGLGFQRKCFCSIFKLVSIVRYLLIGIANRISFSLGISFSATETEKALQSNTSLKGSTKLSAMITGTHS